MKTVLLIDDDDSFRRLLARWLTGAGWAVLEATDGENGIDQAIQHQPHVVVCDLLMPRCNGFQVCRAIREQSETIRQPRIIVTTGSGYSTDQQNAMEAGADAYLVKPFKADELLKSLERPSSDQTTITAVPVQPPKSPSAPPDNQPPRIKFWGVRGSIPTPGPSTVFYGGNTSCVEMRADGEIIILDAGSGIRRLGLSLAEEFKDKSLDITLLITHTHWDHIQGFPFFIPAYNPNNRLRIYGYEGARRGLQTMLTSQMESPYFPVTMRQLPSNIDVIEMKDLEFMVGKVQVKATFVNHPGVCVGYRLNTSGGSVAYLPDNEPFQRMRSTRGAQQTIERMEALKYASDQDQKLIEFIEDVDVLIIDSQYDDAEYQAHVGWGHGCVDDVVALALFARVKQLFLFHHDPDHTDSQITKMQSWARQLVEFQGEKLAVDAACEGVQHVLYRSPTQSPMLT